MESVSSWDAREDPRPRLVELVAAMSLAADLGIGQPMEHGLRTCLIATRLSDQLGLGQQTRADVYWVSLLAMVGCAADSFEIAQVWGDDIAMRAGMFAAGPSERSLAWYFLSRAGANGAPAGRVRSGSKLIATGMRTVVESMTAHCAVTERFAANLDLGPGVCDPLGHTFARWDGKGVPRGVAGDEIALAARIFVVANYVEVEHRLRGLDAATTFARRYSGAVMDPGLVAGLADGARDIFGSLDEHGWDATIDAEPGRRGRLSGAGLDAVLAALGDFADLKSPWFSGHSRRVADLASTAAAQLALPEGEITRLRRGALVHGLGRMGIPNTIWDKPGTLTPSQRERMQMHAYYTDRILRRGNLAPLADLASSSHERNDGSGYPRGTKRAALAPAARMLAAADVYDALTSDRPYRPALTADQAARELRNDVKAGRLDGEAVDAVLAVQGQERARRRAAPDDLTAREIDVLRLIAIGNTTAQVAHKLTISPKTADHHIQHIYAKIGATNRSVAALYAMQHGLV